MRSTITRPTTSSAARTPPGTSPVPRPSSGSTRARPSASARSWSGKPAGRSSPSFSVSSPSATRLSSSAPTASPPTPLPVTRRKLRGCGRKPAAIPIFSDTAFSATRRPARHRRRAGQLWEKRLACSDHRRRLCRARLGRLLRRFRPRRVLRRQGPRQDRGASSRQDADLRAGALGSRRQERSRRPSLLLGRLPGRGARSRRGLHRRRHAVAARRRLRRPFLRAPGGAGDRPGARRLHRHRHEIDCAGRHRRRGRAHHPRDGAAEERTKTVMTELYRPLYLNHAPILFTSRRTAELTKYAANAFLAMKVTFINEIADLCEKVGANVQEVARGIGLDNRIGSKFLHAGPGYGGSCFPKDTLALIKTAQDYDAPIRIVETVAAVNDQRKRAMARKIIQACDGSVRGKTIAVLGLTFKPNTDDMREAPSLSIIAGLIDGGASVRAYDPEGMEQARHVLDGIEYAEDPYACAEGADALVIVTEWDAFRALDLERIRDALKQPILVDLRNIYRADDLAEHGFTYVSVGRPELRPETRDAAVDLATRKRAAS